jgi:hypothetical protein
MLGVLTSNDEGGPLWKRTWDSSFVGIDLHRRRSVIVQQTQAGERLGMTRIDNDPFALAEQVAGWGEATQVVLEATYGWVRHEGA